MQNEMITYKKEKLDFSVLEAINMLRGNIQMAGADCKAITVTSASPNEGKSFISFELAQSLAGLGKKVLYVDCDIRNSNLKKQYEITQKTVGLSEFLCGQAYIQDVIYPTKTVNFYIIFSGKKAPNPSELLSGRLFEMFIHKVKDTFDYIIFDTPPVNVVVDGMIVAKKTDSTILVVKSYFTEVEAARHMQQTLENNGVHILGAVMNLCDANDSRYGRYGYGKYGYGKYGKYGKYGYGKYGKYGYGYGYGYGYDEFWKATPEDAGLDDIDLDHPNSDSNSNK